MDARDSFTLSQSGHSPRPETLSISPDGTSFAIADNETVAIWDLESHALLGAFRVPQRVDALAFASGGDDLLAGHFDGISRLDVGHRRLVARACEVAGRTLTPAEVKRFLGDASAPPTCTSPPADRPAR